ncbi:MAG: anti-sigma factor domain-containing protein [Clostridia bacterium]|nr:anti-sigma factor domain-containing protein [Clostridia bacterium]
MDRQGLILTLGLRHAVVLTKDHEYLKIRRQPSHVVGQTIWFSASDRIGSPSIREGFEMKKKTIVWAMALVLVVAVGAMFALPGLLPFTGPADTTPVQTQMGVSETDGGASLAAEPAVAVLTVQINPEVELYVSASDKVVKVEALNEDAKELDLDSLLGLTSDEAVEALIVMATEKDFIIDEDNLDDFVVVTECPLADGPAEGVEPLLAQIRNQIQNRIQNNENLQNVELAMLRATEQNRIEARQENIGVGLKLLNQRSEQAGLGRAESIRAYFANQERLQFAHQEGLMMQRKAGDGTPDGTQATNQETHRETNRETTGTAAQNGPGSTSGSGEPNGPGGGNGTTQQGKN